MMDPVARPTQLELLSYLDAIGVEVCVPSRELFYCHSEARGDSAHGVTGLNLVPLPRRGSFAHHQVLSHVDAVVRQTVPGPQLVYRDTKPVGQQTKGVS